jgi:hypothetical protein
MIKEPERSIIILTLMLINKGEPFNNSYRLMRILEWKFEIIESKKILDIIKEEYAEYELINGIHYYKITLLGSKLIKQSYKSSLELLLRDYPRQNNFILTVFQSLK